MNNHSTKESIAIKNNALLELISNYKSYIAKTKMQDEVYKWELVKKFKGRPDINVEDFSLEIKSIKFQNLLYAMSIAVTNHIAKDAPEEYRKLFRALFNEDTPLNERVNSFNVESLKLYRSIGGELGHHQDERSIATYLTLHNPEKYTFYKSTFYKEFCKLMGVSPAGKNEKYGHYLDLLNQFIENYIVPDTELTDAVKSYISEYYDGTNNLLLAQDILYCMLNKSKGEQESDLFPEILEAIESESFQNFISDEEFYFEKAKATFEEFKSFQLSELSVLDRILTNFRKVGKFKDFYQGLNESSEEFKITNLIAVLISYCDSNAAFKNELNQYEDKRVLAKASVRQNNWFENLIEFKKTLNYITLPSSIKNALIYIENPSRGITMLSDNHRVKFLRAFVPEKQFDSESFIDDLLNFFEPYQIVCQNELNYTRALSAILYNYQPVRNLWLDVDEEKDLNTIEPSRKYWLYAPGENAEMWDEFYEHGIMSLGWNQLEDLNLYNSKEEITKKLKEFDSSNGSKRNDAKANFDFLKVMNIGDVVFVKKGISKILGYGIVTSDYYFDKSKEEYQHLRNVDWKLKGEWDANHKLVPKTLTNITQFPTELSGYNFYHERLFATMNGLKINNVNINQPVNQILYGPPGTGKTFKLKDEYFPKYTSQESSLTAEQHFKNVVSECSWWQVLAVALTQLGRVKVTELANHKWVLQKALLSNSNTIRATIWGQLQSHTVDNCEFVNVKSKQQPFIFNKTHDSYWEIMEEELKEKAPEIYELIDNVENFNPSADKKFDRFVFTTFHQSYSYEDFIEGIKPVLTNEESDGAVAYQIEDGIFKQICKKAELDPENQYAIFIDEINRGNVSAIFGELITLIEQDKRKGAVNEMSVTLPYSKKSFSVPKNLDIIGTMNTADRSVEALDTALRRRFSFVEMLPNPQLLKEKEIEGINQKVLLETINERIEVLVDRDHTIGHAFFINDTTIEELRNSFANKIIPLLQEYFYGDYSKMEMVIGSAFFDKKEVSKVKFAVKSDEFDAEGKVYHIKNISDDTIMSDKDFISAINNLIGIE